DLRDTITAHHLSTFPLYNLATKFFNFQIILIWRQEDPLLVVEIQQAEDFSKSFGCSHTMILDGASEEPAEQKTIDAVETNLDLVSGIFAVRFHDCLQDKRLCPGVGVKVGFVLF